MSPAHSVIFFDQNQPPSPPHSRAAHDSPVNEGQCDKGVKGISPTSSPNARAVLKDKQQPIHSPSPDSSQPAKPHPFPKKPTSTVEDELPEYCSISNNVGEAAAASFIVEAMLETQREMVADEVSGVFTFKQGFYTSLCPDILEDEEIDAFMRASPLYDWEARQWTGIPAAHSSSSCLTKPELIEQLSLIISAVMEEFGNSTTRKAKDTSRVKLFHEMADSESARHYSSPSLVIVAEGSSFELPPPNHSVDGVEEGEPQLIGFTNITTCIEVAQYADLSDDNFLKENATHGVYAQQLFLHQPNRRFVRTISIDEMGVDLFHFDRSGLHRGSLNNYHSHFGARSFIRMLVVLSSVDEEVLGLDTSIRWKIDAAGRKSRGTLTVRDSETKKTTRYDLTSVQPVFKQYCLGNRGTVCWSVRDRNKKQTMIVKDSWRNESATPEYENLKQARGLRGVVQMVSYEEKRSQTKEFVLGMHLPDDPTGGAANLIHSRIVMEQHGRHLGHFESEKQFLCALRDAISGHRGLYIKGDTIHRDMSRGNILLGKPGAPPGSQGVVIDLDMATRRSSVGRKAGEVVGHLQYLSISMLLNLVGDDDIVAHDYLDDLESGFYVTATVMYEQDGPNKLQDPCPEILDQWLEFQEMSNCRENLQFKKKFLLSGKPSDPTQHMASYWSHASRVLLQKFYKFTREMAREKIRIRECQDESWKARSEKLLSEPNVLRNYDRVLGFFDEAIAKITKLAGEKKGHAMAGGKRTAQEDGPVEDSNSDEQPRQLRARRQRRRI
ncbi:hypothetical protein MD484_g4505, partial [Candolleomyces efflorescens]